MDQLKAMFLNLEPKAQLLFLRWAKREIKKAAEMKRIEEEIEQLGPPPPELKGLQLYEKDPVLRRQWPELMDAWKESFPGVDIAREIKKAHAWEVANPRRRKTSRGRPRYLYQWLERAQNRGRTIRYERPEEDTSWINGS